MCNAIEKDNEYLHCNRGRKMLPRTEVGGSITLLNTLIMLLEAHAYGQPHLHTT